MDWGDLLRRDRVNCLVVPMGMVSLDEVLGALRTYEKLIHCLEYRLDYSTPKEAPKALREFSRAVERPGICTVREVDEGGHVQWPREEKARVLRECLGLGHAIDVEYRVLREYGVGGDAVLIASIHDMGGTLGPVEAMEVVKAMSKEAQVVKLAKLARAIDDVATLMVLLRDLSRSIRSKVTILPMGNYPWIKLARYLMSLLGSYINYVALDNFPVAPGQLTLRELSILEKMGQQTPPLGTNTTIEVGGGHKV